MAEWDDYFERVLGDIYGRGLDVNWTDPKVLAGASQPLLGSDQGPSSAVKLKDLYQQARDFLSPPPPVPDSVPPDSPMAISPIGASAPANMSPTVNLDPAVPSGVITASPDSVTSPGRGGVDAALAALTGVPGFGSLFGSSTPNSNTVATLAGIPGSIFGGPIGGAVGKGLGGFVGGFVDTTLGNNQLNINLNNPALTMGQLNTDPVFGDFGPAPSNIEGLPSPTEEGHAAALALFGGFGPTGQAIAGTPGQNALNSTALSMWGGVPADVELTLGSPGTGDPNGPSTDNNGITADGVNGTVGAGQTPTGPTPADPAGPTPDGTAGTAGVGVGTGTGPAGGTGTPGGAGGSDAGQAPHTGGPIKGKGEQKVTALGGEYVVHRRAAKQFRPLLDALNSLTPYKLDSLLQEARAYVNR